MGESPVFTCKAHVFTIDPKTKKTWVPASNQAITVSFFFDKAREVYRILSIDETAQDPAKKMTINSIMSERMSFKKTSQKFGQWADTNSGAVYGLGFSNESELDKFVEQFCQALDHTRRLRKQQQQQHPEFEHAPSYAPAGDLPTAGVDLDHVPVDAWRLEREKLQMQMQQMARNLQKLEADNAALRAVRPVESERLAQLEKENAFLKNRVKQLEDSSIHHEQQLQQMSTVTLDLQRRLQEAVDTAGQLARLQQPAYKI